MRNGMLLRRAYIVLVVVCLLCSTSQATVGKSTLSLSVDILMMDEGLPTNEVRQIYKDSTGFMWFMTNAGIVKYDSMERTVFTTNPRDPRSISSEEFTCFVGGEDEDWWIGTINGLNRFNKKTGKVKRYKHDPNQPGSLSNDNVMDMCKDAQGRLWVATDDGLNLWDPQTDTFTVFRHDPTDPHSLAGNRINQIRKDPSGIFWLSIVSNTIGSWDPVTQRFTSLEVGDNVVVLQVDAFGGLWWGTWGEGLNYFNPATGDSRVFKSDPALVSSLSGNIVITIKEDAEQNLWIGTYNEGSCIIDPRTFEILRVEFTSKTDPNTRVISVKDFFWDPQGNLWLATMNHGVGRYDVSQPSIQYWRKNPEDLNTLVNNRVFALSVSPDNTVWVGTDGGGLDHFDPLTGQFTHYAFDPENPASLPSNTIVSLMHDRNGQLWIGGWVTKKSMLSRFDPSTRTFEHFYWLDERADVVTRTLWQDSQGWIWVGLETEELGFFHPETGESYFIGKEKGYKGDTLRKIYEDHTGRIWITTNVGVQYYDRAADRFFDFLEEETYPITLPPCIYFTVFEDSRHVLWFGTSEGLFGLSPDRKTVVHYTAGDGLAHNVVKSIEEDRFGRLWISFDTGLSCFDPLSMESQNFDKMDGLQSYAFTANCSAMGKKGEVYFGGLNGFNCIWPDEKGGNPFVPPIVLTAFEIMGKPLPLQRVFPLTEPLRLNYDQNFLAFEFATLNYTQPHKNQHAYRLLPLEENWNYIGARTRRYGRYTSLQPGQYWLQLKGANNDGIWNEEGITIPIVITPPFWETWWFRLILLAAVIGYSLLYYWRTQRWNRQLETKVQEQTKKLQGMNKVLENLSMQDGLTGVPNRRCFDERFHVEWNRAVRNQTALSLLFCDVDFFKNFNDHYGHLAGDECLKMVANLLQQQVKRPGDLFARYGGEEFVILLADTHIAQATSFAEKLCSLVEEKAWPHDMSMIRPVVTVSIGIASVVPSAGLLPERLIQAADKGLYLAKNSGRNRAVACEVPCDSCPDAAE